MVLDHRTVCPPCFLTIDAVADERKLHLTPRYRLHRISHGLTEGASERGQAARSRRAIDGTGRGFWRRAGARNDAWTQFAGLVPDGRLAIIGRGWESPENASWEEKHRPSATMQRVGLYDSTLATVEAGRHEPHRCQRVSSTNKGIIILAYRPDQTRIPGYPTGHSHPSAWNATATKRKTEQESKEVPMASRLAERPPDRL